MAPPGVSVIIATWNAAGVLGRCLESLRGQRIASGFETIVVDNASTDETADVLRRHADHVAVIAKERNVGFSAANNEAAAMARGRTLFFLNSDTELLSEDVLATLDRTLWEDEVGLCAPRLVNPDGTLQPSSAAHPGVARALIVSSGLGRLLPRSLRTRVAPECGPHDRPMDVDWVMGAAVAVRADLFAELGGFWPHMYAEDQDLAYRAEQRGWRVRLEPSVRVLHVGNHSLAQRWSSAERAEQVAAAELTFLRTHYRRLRAAAIRAIVGAGYALRAIGHRALGRGEAAAVFGAMARVYATGRLRG